VALDLYQLKVFWTFAKVRHFTKTAELLYVTQSAVSHSLKKLENSVGTPLIFRHAGQYGLTEAGIALMGVCEKAFREIENFEGELKREEWQRRQILRLGAPVEFGTTLLVEQIKAFLDAHPHLHVNCIFSHHLHAPLLQGEVDLIIDCRPCHRPEVERIPLFRERYVVIASPSFLANHPIERPSDLETVRVLSMDEGGEWWNNFIFAQTPENRVVLRQIVQINHVRGMINGALSDLGVSFVPRYTVENKLRDGRLCDVFPGARLMDDHFCIYIKRDRMAIEKNKALTTFLTQRFSGFGESV
jgi:DNA-binding transcriptional LysR family regulator